MRSVFYIIVNQLVVQKDNVTFTQNKECQNDPVCGSLASQSQ